MFEKFLQVYGPASNGDLAGHWANPVLMAEPGYAYIAPTVAGLPLGGGLFRFLTQQDGPGAQHDLSVAFPEFTARAVPFARDWLGRLFAVDRGRRARSASQLLVLEPGSGDAFEIDEGLEDFLDVDLTQAPETYLETEFFGRWRAAGGQVPAATQCVGFKTPLFLGGADTTDNLEITDVRVYWNMMGQLRCATRHLPPGTRIGGVTLT